MCLVLAGAGAAEPEPLRFQYHCGLRAQETPRSERGAGAAAPVSRMSASAISRTQVLRNSTPIAGPISPRKCLAIVSPIAGKNTGEPGSHPSAEVQSALHSRTSTTRYQALRGRYQPRATAAEAAKSPRADRPARGDTALMLRLGLLLGLVYLVFLMFWVWATRLRPRRTRNGRGI
jgi:hypothetical protein